jgi:hypothetical protein
VNRFYLGMHHPSDAKNVDLACISYAAIRKRKSDFTPPREGWIEDSGAFRELELHGGYRDEPAVYARASARWARIGKLHAIVAQDYMCEPFMLARTGLTVAQHQCLTIERYDALLAAWRDEGEPAPLMPVIQGWTPADYQRCVLDYGDRLTPGMLVGVGSVCKRQGRVGLVEDIICSILEVAPTLRLHLFRDQNHGASEPDRVGFDRERRQHGVVLPGAQGRPQRERLARGRGLQRARQPGPYRPLPTLALAA